MEFFTCQNKKKTCQAFLWRLHFLLVGKFMEREVCYFICYFSTNNADARLYKLDYPTTPYARLALTLCSRGRYKGYPVALITVMIYRAGDTGREPRVDATWVSFRAGVKTESRTAAVPAFPRGFWPGWKNCRPLRYVGCA